MLYLVSTPIGNLKDITYRAIEVLNQVDMIACEDTRHSMILLNHYSIKKPLFSYHKFNLKQSGEKIMEYLKEGKDIALISDAGTPGISDPGQDIVNLCIKNNQPYTFIPGANAATSALVMSGFDSSLFTFCGFIPENNLDRKIFFDKIKNVRTSLIFYCAPHKLNKDLENINKNLGLRSCALVKEISKIHESVHITKTDEVIAEPKGEYVVVVEGAKKSNPLNELEIFEHVNFYTDQGYSKMDAIKAAARDRDLSKNTVYKKILDES